MAPALPTFRLKHLQGGFNVRQVGLQVAELIMHHGDLADHIRALADQALDDVFVFMCHR